MTLQVRDIMTTDLYSVCSQIDLDNLEENLTKHHISGAPVIDQGKLVGVVSRADIIRRLNIEHCFAVNSIHFEEGPFYIRCPEDEINQLGAMVGERMEQLTVKDIMSTEIKSVSPNESIGEAARYMLENHVHRLLVIEGNLVGIVSSTDFVKQCASDSINYC